MRLCKKGDQIIVLSAINTQMFADPRSILRSPTIYSFFAKLVGGSARARYVSDYVRPTPNDRILDIGCGPGDILDYLPSSIDYIGFDSDEGYIAEARKHFAGRGVFVCRRVNTTDTGEFGKFDIVLAMGVLHHLDDDEAVTLFRVATTCLKPVGRLVTLDGCFTPEQSPTARYLVSRDRGQFVRTPERYIELASKVFPNVISHIRHDLMRIPYTHVILECRK